MMTINVKNTRKFEKIVKKSLNIEKHSITSMNYTVAYCQTLKGVPLLLSLKKPKKRQKFSKSLKNKFYQKIAEICDIKKLKTNPWSNKKNSVPYQQTLKELFWPLRLKKRI